jgi:uncharacterized protein (UPF0276 family)
MPALTVNYSKALVQLVRGGDLRVDGVEVGGYLSPAQILVAQRELPGVRFEFHASRLGLFPFTRRILDAYLKVTQSRWISCHISMLSPLEVNLGMRWQKYVLFTRPEQAQQSLIQNVRRLSSTASLPVILENMPGFPDPRHKFECDPIIINRILQATGCGLLLDLGHARVGAMHHGVSPEAFLELVPLDRTRQIHVSGPRLRNGVLYDAHEPLSAEDYALLKWTLARTQPEVVTLEYYRDLEALREQVLHLQKMLG